VAGLPAAGSRGDRLREQALGRSKVAALGRKPARASQRVGALRQ
jgi:hypothetical protein